VTEIVEFNSMFLLYVYLSSTR